MIPAVSVEVVKNPALSSLNIIVFCVGLTAIAFIALVVWLDWEPEREVVELPSRR